MKSKTYKMPQVPNLILEKNKFEENIWISAYGSVLQKDPYERLHYRQSHSIMQYGIHIWCEKQDQKNLLDSEHEFRGFVFFFDLSHETSKSLHN